MDFDAAYLLAFAGELGGLHILRSQLVTAEGRIERVHRLRYGMVLMAVLVWLTVIVVCVVITACWKKPLRQGQSSQTEAGASKASDTGPEHFAVRQRSVAV